eukprot:6760468-Prymnesium_polylepis.1
MLMSLCSAACVDEVTRVVGLGGGASCSSSSPSIAFLLLRIPAPPLRVLHSLLCAHGAQRLLCRCLSTRRAVAKQ